MGVEGGLSSISQTVSIRIDGYSTNIQEVDTKKEAKNTWPSQG